MQYPNISDQEVEGTVLVNKVASPLQFESHR